jgi:hypothetical protein
MILLCILLRYSIYINSFFNSPSFESFLHSLNKERSLNIVARKQVIRSGSEINSNDFARISLTPLTIVFRGIVAQK